jgi:hypothetical protein
MQGQIILTVPLSEFMEGLKNAITEALQQSGPSSRMLNSEQVMEMLNVSSTTLQKWRNNGSIPFTRIDNKIYYPESDILDTLKNRSHDQGSN